MNIDFDSEVDTAYLLLNDSKIIESEEVMPGVIFDFNELGGVVGVEILGIKKKDPRYLLVLKIPFRSHEDFKKFETFLIEKAKA